MSRLEAEMDDGSLDRGRSSADAKGLGPSGGSCPGPLTRPVRVLIVDDYRIIREGLRAILETDAGIQVVGQAAAVGDAVSQFRELRPDVTLLDVHLARESGLDALRKIRSLDPRAAVLMVSASEWTEDIRRARKSGARGYILKDTCASDLITAIRAVNGGGRCWLTRADGPFAEPVVRIGPASRIESKVRG